MQAVTNPSRIVGRYAIFDPIASGGMATVYLGKLLGEAGFARTVAIKRLHENFVKDPLFVAMMTDEARLASRIRHPNVVPTLDVVSMDGELLVVMEYVHGESLSGLLAFREGGERRPIPLGYAAAIVLDALQGLHAAHEAKNERGQPLDLVHRDVSPHNILVGTDGVARVLDFGVAKAAGRVQSTSTGQIKGKVAYMAPEQMTGNPMDRRVDVYAAGIVLWEALTGKRLFDGDNEAQLIFKVLSAPIEPPSKIEPSIPQAVDDVVMTALDRDPNGRFPTAHDFAVALEKAAGSIPRAREIGAWVEQRGKTSLLMRAERIEKIEMASEVRVVSPSNPVLTPAEAVAGTAVMTPSQPQLPVRIQSSPSFQTAEPAPQGWPSWMWALIILGVATAVVVPAAIVIGFAKRSPAPVAIVVSTPPAPAPTPSASATEKTLEPSPEPTEEASAAPPVVPSPKPVHAAASAKPPKENCNPPYTIDSSGVRIPKRACFVNK